MAPHALTDRSISGTVGPDFQKPFRWASRKVKPFRFTPSGMLRGRETAGSRRAAGAYPRGNYITLEKIDAMEIVNALNGIAFTVPITAVAIAPTAG
jgi:hypothetical protein